MKIGVNFSIDLNAIDSSRVIQHQNGKRYLNMTSFIDTENKGPYGDNGFITHKKNKDEQGQMQILGNTTVFFTEDSAPKQQAPAYGQNQQAPQQAPQQGYGQYQGNQPPQQGQYTQQAPQQGTSPQPTQQAPNQGGYHDDIPM